MGIKVIFSKHTDKLEFVGRADSQVVRKICVVVFALRRSVSFYSSLANWKFVDFPVIANQSADWRGNLLDRSTISRG